MWTVNWIDLAQEMYEKWTLMNTVPKVTIRQNVGYSCLAWAGIAQSV